MVKFFDINGNHFKNQSSYSFSLIKDDTATFDLIKIANYNPIGLFRGSLSGRVG